MKKIYKIAIAFYFLFLSFISFAQIGSGPGDEDNNGGNALEGGDPVATTINSKLWILILLGILYTFFMVKRNRQLNKLN
jgi:hypothetical protein